MAVTTWSGPTWHPPLPVPHSQHTTSILSLTHNSLTSGRRWPQHCRLLALGHLFPALSDTRPRPS